MCNIKIYIILEVYLITNQKNNNMTTTELRVSVLTMTKKEMINYRDQLESNWDESLRPLMLILARACINKFNTTLINL